MKKQLLTLLALAGFNGFAEECSQAFEADYEVVQAGKTQHIKLWRNQAAVAYQNGESKVTDFWTSAPKQRLKLVRLFDEHQKGIEYEAKTYGNKITWNNLFHKISPRQLANMTLQSSSGQGCNLTETYSKTEHGKTVEVKWLPQYQIAKSIKVETKQNTLSWRLTKLEPNVAKVNQQFAHWDKYYLTDYVDIGDNESDPFLAKMINMGFVQGGASGFYDAQGNQLGGHGHHHQLLIPLSE